MANQWLRMYADFRSDPKVRTMSEALQLRLAWLYCLRCEGPTENLSEDEIRFGLGLDDETFRVTFHAFQNKGFIDENWAIPNWNKRQFLSDCATDRVRKHRAKKALKQDETFHETRETRNVTDQNRTEHKKHMHELRAIRAIDPVLSSQCQALYAAYPRRIAPDAAYRAIAKALRKKPFAELMPAVERFATQCQRNGTEAQFIPYPATWFNAGRYNDEDLAKAKVQFAFADGSPVRGAL